MPEGSVDAAQPNVIAIPLPQVDLNQFQGVPLGSLNIREEHPDDRAHRHRVEMCTTARDTNTHYVMLGVFVLMSLAALIGLLGVANERAEIFGHDTLKLIIGAMAGYLMGKPKK